jgi:hypothetical protein
MDDDGNKSHDPLYELVQQVGVFLRREKKCSQVIVIVSGDAPNLDTLVVQARSISDFGAKFFFSADQYFVANVLTMTLKAIQNGTLRFTSQLPEELQKLEVRIVEKKPDEPEKPEAGSEDPGVPGEPPAV